MDQQPQVNTGTDLGSVASTISDPTERAIVKTSEKEAKEVKDFGDKKIAELDKLTPAKPPQLTEGPKQENYQTDPMKTFGSGAMFLATFGSLLTRHPLLSALNAGASVMTAANNKDAASFKAAMDKWKLESENAFKMADWDLKQYENAIAKGDTEVKMYSAAHKNETAGLALQAKMHEADLKNAQNQLTAAKESQKVINNYLELKGKEFDKNNPNATPLEKAQNDMDNFAQANATKSGFFVKEKAGELDDEKFEKYKKDPAMQTALKSYMVTGDVRGALGGGSFGNKDLSVKMQTLQRMATEKNPDFNPGVVKMMAQGYQKELNAVQGQNAKISLASNVLDTSIPSLIESAKKLNMSDSTDINSLYNYARGHLNSEDFKNFQTQLRAATTDYAQFLGRGRQTVHSDEEALKILNENQNINSLKGFQEAVTTERDNVQKGIDQTLEQIQNKMSGKVSHDTPIKTATSYPKPNADAIKHFGDDDSPDAVSNFEQIFGPGSAKDYKKSK